MKIEIVSATRFSEGDFWDKSPLGVSLRRIGRDPRVAARLAFSNRRGLPEVFNEAIQAPENAEILVFMHDDVWIDDFFLADHVIGGLERYDVIGIAGNRRRVPGQPGWAFVNTRFIRDEPGNVSGAIAVGEQPFGSVVFFGSVPAECELLDGVFLAARKSTLLSRKVLFDPRFDFHFYDLDFSRSARARGLRLGTWPICLTHQSQGSFGSEPWQKKYLLYLEKWEPGRRA